MASDGQIDLCNLPEDPPTHQIDQHTLLAVSDEFLLSMIQVGRPDLGEAVETMYRRGVKEAMTMGVAKLARLCATGAIPKADGVNDE